MLPHTFQFSPFIHRIVEAPLSSQYTALDNRISSTQSETLYSLCPTDLHLVLKLTILGQL